MSLLTIILKFILFILISKRSLDYIHILQLKKYDTGTYRKWIDENTAEAISLKGISRKKLRPFVFTNRAKRLFILNTLLNLLVFLFVDLKVSRLSIMEISSINRYFVLFIEPLVLGILYIFQAFMLVISNYLIGGLENNINSNFYKSAKEKILSRSDLKVIAISGSFGKTSTKFIIDEILSLKYNVLNTPESYNTAMGLSKVINEDLREEHQVFIAEMGSMKIGDIKELTDLVSPDIGIITSIGESNMETFLNIDNIAKTQYELIEGLPTEGIGIFNYDNEHIKKIAHKTFKEKILYGLEDKEDLDIYAEDIYYQDIGTRFTLKDKDGNSAKIRTRLLGIHNVYNILAAVALGKSMGLSLEEMKLGIEKINPFPHRLNPIKNGNHIIIDDSENSNPIGAKTALDVLSEFKDVNKLIVTPGMVDLGDMEDNYNYEFGVQISKVCDYVILINEGKTKSIYRGLEEHNYNMDKVYLIDDFNEAEMILDDIVEDGDIVLYENQLPNREK